MIWDECKEVTYWNHEEVNDSYKALQQLALEESLMVLIDGLDELGLMSMKDVSTAGRAAADPDLKVGMKPLCARILTTFCQAQKCLQLDGTLGL